MNDPRPDALPAYPQAPPYNPNAPPRRMVRSFPRPQRGARSRRWLSALG